MQNAEINVLTVGEYIGFIGGDNMMNPLFGFPNQYKRGYRPVEGQIKNPEPLPAILPAMEMQCKDISKKEKGGFCLKSSSLGGIMIPDHTDKGTTYNMASLTLDTSVLGRFYIQLHFACNIQIIKARLYLTFQIFKQGTHPFLSVPVSSVFLFFRPMVSTEANTVSFTACDFDFAKNECCNYSVYVECGSFETEGMAFLDNPVLTAVIVEEPM